MAKKGNRREQIRELLALQERLGVEELAEALDVTSMTIRRDLTAIGEKWRDHSDLRWMYLAFIVGDGNVIFRER